MKRFMTMLALLALVALASGCCCLSKQEKAEVHHKQLAMQKYVVEYMDKGKTTADQDKRMLRECLDSWLALDWAVNEDKEAKALLDARLKAAEEKPD